MIFRFLLDNLASWTAQVFIVSSLGALLPLILRLRHPRTQLLYSHLILAACVVLPVVQPWGAAFLPQDKHAEVTITFGPRILSDAVGNQLLWFRVALWILASGIVARLI